MRNKAKLICLLNIILYACTNIAVNLRERPYDCVCVCAGGGGGGIMMVLDFFSSRNGFSFGKYGKGTTISHVYLFLLEVLEIVKHHKRHKNYSILTILFDQCIFKASILQIL